MQAGFTRMPDRFRIFRMYLLSGLLMRYTNHWMRPGAYGLDAADAGCIAVLWTNTVPNMPPWGGDEA